MDEHNPDLSAASDQVQQHMATYNRLLATGDDPEALNAFVDSLGGPISGSETDKLWQEYIVLHRDVADLKKDDQHCLNLFEAASNFADKAESLGLNVLTGLFGNLAFEVLIEHLKCYLNAHGYKPPARSKMADDDAGSVMAMIIDIGFAGTIARELFRSRKS